jgi:hypothetical protein
MVFRSLLYTDCRADESLRGGTGYQFQAASANTHAPDEMVMLQQLMYRPSPDLMAREAPVEQYPPSFAYAKTADGYAFGAGVYLGRVSGDGRQGNQITHALFTSDIEDLSTTRPAQLFGAEFWVYEKQPSKQLVTTEAPLLYREDFDLEVLHALVLRSREPEQFLAAVLSAFERATGEPRVKVIVSCSDPVEAMQWIAVTTMLLPTAQALGLSIRAFVNDPTAAPEHIVAIHPPSMDRAPDVAALRFVSGIDLDHQRTGSIEITERAAYLSAKFVNDDPYEVLDSVELAGRLRASEPTNRRVAGVLTFNDPLTSASAVTAIAEAFETFDAEEYDEFAEPLVAALELADQATDLTPEPFLRVVHAIARFADPTSELADRMLENVLVRASAATDFALALVGESTLRWEWRHPPAAEGQSAKAVLAILSLISDDALPAAFEFARRTGIPTKPDEMRDAAQRLADVWMRRPALATSHRSWVHSDMVFDLLVQRLQRSVIGGSTQDLHDAVEKGEWDWLLDVDVVLRGSGPLAAEIASRSIPKADPRKQQYLIGKIAGYAAVGGWVPLWRNRTPDITEVMYWLDVRPRDVLDPRFAAAIGPAVGRAVEAGGVRGRLLRVIRDIYASAPDALPKNVARLGRQNAEFSRDLETLRARRHPAGIGHRLASVDAAILQIRLNEAVTALTGNAQTPDIAEFLEECPVDATDALIATLDDAAKNYPAEMLTIAFELSRHKLRRSTLKAVKAFPLQWYEAADDESRELVGKRLHTDWPEWDETESQFERKNESTAKKVGRLFNREKGN